MSCFHLFTFSERLEGSNAVHCDQCKSDQPALKAIRIAHYPPHLIVQLERFRVMPITFTHQKVNVLVTFPVVDIAFDLAPHRYRVAAVINHVGSMTSGHYTALVFDDQSDRWLRYDDDQISVVAPEHVVTSAAYILFLTIDSSPTTMPPADCPAQPEVPSTTSVSPKTLSEATPMVPRPSVSRVLRVEEAPMLSKESLHRAESTELRHTPVALSTQQSRPLPPSRGSNVRNLTAFFTAKDEAKLSAVSTQKTARRFSAIASPIAEDQHTAAAAKTTDDASPIRQQPPVIAGDSTFLLSHQTTESIAETRTHLQASDGRPAVSNGLSFSSVFGKLQSRHSAASSQSASTSSPPPPLPPDPSLPSIALLLDVRQKQAERPRLPPDPSDASLALLENQRECFRRSQSSYHFPLEQESHTDLARIAIVSPSDDFDREESETGSTSEVSSFEDSSESSDDEESDDE